MRSLLDVNVLIALMDADHVFHEKAHAWYGKNLSDGWSSCPITENGLIRITSHPNYHPTSPRRTEDVIRALKTFKSTSDHQFWPDSLSVTEENTFHLGQILGSKQLTDIYLLALATSHGGKLVTFDSSVNLAAVVASSPDNLCVFN